MKLARLYIPKYPNQPVLQLEKRLAAAFNGYTLYSFGVGVWRSPDGPLIQEPVYVYDVIIERDEDVAALEEILLQYKAEAEQTAVLYVVNNQPTFL